MLSTAQASQARPLSLALSGGGVKCAAQAGVLAVLDAVQLPVGAIAGTSGGGVVAILYGLGYSPREICDYMADTHLLEVWDLDPERCAIFGTDKIRARIHRMTGDKTFADLKIPVTVVTADIHTRTEVDLNSGRLEDAMLATMAIPAFFAPVRLGASTLVDGGIVNPLPVDIAKQQGPLVVAVDVVFDSLNHRTDQIFEARGPLRYAEAFTRRLGLNTMLVSAYEAVLTATMHLIEHSLRETPPAAIVRPAVGDIGLFAFDLAAKAYQAGEAAAEAALPELEALVYPALKAEAWSAPTWRHLRRD